MPDRRPFSHILFDLDHTLAYYPLPTAGVIAETFLRLDIPLTSLGAPDEVATLYDNLWVELERGIRTADELRLAVWRRLLASRGLLANGVAERIAAEYGATRRAHDVRLFDGVRELLAELRRAGYGLGLLTNGLSDAQWDKIHSTRIEPFFDAILVAGDAGLYKPDPLAFAALLERLGASRDRALFVGDSYEMDILGAEAAGIACAWIRPAGTPIPGPVVPDYQFANVLDVREVAL